MKTRDTRERLQRQRTDEQDLSQAQTLHIPASVHDTLASEGQSLDSETQAFMEPRFGYNFGGVRIHTDERAAQSAREVNAQAYTVGSDVVFGQGAYAPETQEGRGLLAHELTHVMQQGNARDGQESLTLGHDNDSYEQQANRVSSTVITGASPMRTEAIVKSSPGSVIQRQQPTTEQRLDNLEKHQQAQDIHMKAIETDQKWLNNFDKQFSSYKETIDRISLGLQTAIKGFEGAQKKQEETNAEVMGAISVFLTLAGGFEWAFVPGLGKLLGASEKAAEHIASVAHAVADAAVDSAKEGKKEETPATDSIPGAQTPAGAAGGDPLSFLTSNSAALEHQRQNVLEAFSKRADSTKSFTDDDWVAFDVGKQEQTYNQLMVDLQKDNFDANKLASDADIARILEKHIWSHWIVEKVEVAIKAAHEERKELEHEEQYGYSGSGSGSADGESPESTSPEDVSTGEKNYSLGTDIEDHLNTIGIAGDAHVTLTGHWYEGNSPDNWGQLLHDWASTYNKGIGNDSK